MKKSLNYLLVGTMLLLCLTNCKTYKESLAEVSYNPMNNRLENMVVNSNGYSDYQRIISDYALKDVEKNMVSKNYLNNNENLGRINIEVKGGIIPGAWNTISWCMTPLYLIPEILMLFGVPTGNYTSTLTATFSIYDKFDNQIASYTYENKKSWNNGFYYGKSPKRFAIDTAKEFMKNFRNDYDKDFNQICANLKNPQNNNKQNTYLAKTTSKSKNEKININTATLYLCYSSPKKNYYDFKVYYEIDGKFVGTTSVQEYFVVNLPIGTHKLCAYINPKKIKNDYSIDGNTQYFSNLEEIKRYSTYEPDCESFNIVAGNNYYKYSGKLELLTEKGYTEELNKGYLVRKSNDVNSTENYLYTYQSNDKQVNKQYNSYSANTYHSYIDNNVPTTTNSADNLYALIITNENYDYLDNVTFANHDGEVFKEYCIKTLGIPERQIFYYEDATFGKIADGVGKIKYCLNNFENSKAIVYYCGHGIPDEKTGDAYIVPVDGKGTNMTTCYPLQTLYKTLAATKAESITYFMDACFTGANKEGSMLIAARGVAREPKKEVLAGKSIVFSASSGDETAMTLEEQGHGLFTYYLLKKLQETEGNVSYGELSDYIKKNVQKDAFLINEKPQTPVVATSPAVVNTWKTMKLK